MELDRFPLATVGGEQGAPSIVESFLLVFILGLGLGEGGGGDSAPHERDQKLI